MSLAKQDHNCERTRKFQQSAVLRYEVRRFAVCESFDDYLPFTLLTHSLQNNPAKFTALA